MKKKFKKILLFSLCFVMLLASFGLSACSLLDSILQDKPNRPNVDIEQPQDETIYTMPARMTLTGSPMAEHSVTIQATIQPDYADNKTVDWLVEWVNPASTFANGKNVTDYVTISPQSDGSTIATVTCSQAFGEQIKIIVTSRHNSDVKAECTVDYAKKVLDTELKFYNSTYVTDLEEGLFTTIPKAVTSYTFLAGFPYVDYGAYGEYPEARISSAVEYSAFTVDDTFTFDVTLNYNQEYLNALTAQGLPLKTYPNGSSVKINFDNPYFFGYDALDTFTLGSSHFNILKCQGESYNKLVSAAKTMGDKSFGTLQVKFIGTYSTFTKSIDIKMSPSIFLFSPTNIILDNTNIII